MEIVELKLLPSGRYTVAFSNGQEMKLSLDIVSDMGLYRGREISDEEFLELSNGASLGFCKERALRIIGARPHSCKELFDKLVQKGESEENAAATIAWLLQRKYLNDGDYAALLVRHYSAKGYGRGKVKNELFKRGIGKELWDEALSEMPEMDDKVYALLCRKLRSESPDRAEIKKATDSLFRRGFSWEEIKSAVRKFEEEQETES